MAPVLSVESVLIHCMNRGDRSSEIKERGVAKCEATAVAQSADGGATLQAAYLDVLLVSSFKWHAAVRVPHRLWRDHPALLEVYFEVVKASGECSA